jgi:hypothetical protein
MLRLSFHIVTIVVVTMIAVMIDIMEDRAGGMGIAAIMMDIEVVTVVETIAVTAS